MIYPEPDSTERRKRYQDNGDVAVKEKGDFRVMLCVNINLASSRCRNSAIVYVVK